MYNKIINPVTNKPVIPQPDFERWSYTGKK